MNYAETIEFLFNSLPMYQRTGKAAYKANLDNTLAFDLHLGHPHRQFSAIHVAGTNGKGSVSHMLASVLRENGYRTGLYTSPHLLDYRERIRIDGKMIPESKVVSFISRNEKIIREIRPSFFEMTVALAFEYFASEKVDFAVVETGLGGRLDSTNILIPLVSVITNVSMDHTDFLGNTIPLIAAEKAGIIKTGVDVVTGKCDPETLDVITQVSMEKKAPLVRSWDLRQFLFQTALTDNRSRYFYHNPARQQNESWECDLNGKYQSENIQTTLAVLDTLSAKGVSIKEEKTRQGLRNTSRNTGLRGRWETLGSNPSILCDTAHNEEGVRWVMSQLKEIPAKKLHIIWGMVSDKSPEKIFPLLPGQAVLYLTRPDIPRGMDPGLMRAHAEKAGLSYRTFPDVQVALTAAIKAAGKEDLIFIGGSTFTVADALKVLSEKGK